MIGQFDFVTVLLSFTISYLGAYIAISACEQLRTVYVKNPKATVIEVAPWLIFVGSALGGVGVWSMHFIGMSAMSLTDSDGNEVNIQYNTAVSIMSLLLAILGGIGGVSIASKDRFFAKTKEQILELFVDDFKSLSLAEIKNITQLKFLFLITMTDVKYLAVGGVVTACGLVLMHYLGMAAMEFEGHIQWNIGMIVASVILAILAAIAAFFILFRLLSIYPELESLRLGSSFVMAIAVCGMHYFGMMAASFKPHANEYAHLNWKSESISKSESLYPVLFAAMVVLWMLAMIIFADLRFKLNSHHKYLQKIMPNESLSTVLNRMDLALMSRQKRSKGNRGSHRSSLSSVAPEPNRLQSRSHSEMSVPDDGAIGSVASGGRTNFLAAFMV